MNTTYGKVRNCLWNYKKDNGGRQGNGNQKTNRNTAFKIIESSKFQQISVKYRFLIYTLVKLKELLKNIVRKLLKDAMKDITKYGEKSMRFRDKL